MELWERGILEDLEPGTINTLQAIHRYLFQDIYQWAGEIRSVTFAKDTFRFAAPQYLQAQLGIITTMPDSSWDEIINKYTEVNVAHPFQEGNGRRTRLWLDNLLERRLGQHSVWDHSSRADYMSAMNATIG